MRYIVAVLVAGGVTALLTLVLPLWAAMVIGILAGMAVEMFIGD